MSDKELLELAAKAAGIKYHAYVDNPMFGTGINIGDVDVPLWNPLKDDGDALRLAAKLSIDPMFNLNMGDGRPCVSVIFPLSGDYTSLSEIDHGDTCAATRRAIVRAAAEIGRSMP